MNIDLDSIESSIYQFFFLVSILMLINWFICVLQTGHASLFSLIIILEQSAHIIRCLHGIINVSIIFEKQNMQRFSSTSEFSYFSFPYMLHKSYALSFNTNLYEIGVTCNLSYCLTTFTLVVISCSLESCALI